ncbi:zinc ribbon domain-containing protein [Candidatus Dojkabacteria bacterium]|nr:zinc ribbon domain-containing protein [Candidatus Dojkabacteria bacterium]
MESFFFDILSFLEDLDFIFFVKILGIIFGVFWLIVVGWTWTDASERSGSLFFKIISSFLVLTLNIFGLIIYLIIRPKYPKDEEYWIDLERRYLKFEADGLEDCPYCGFEIMPNYVHCPNCGSKLRVKCNSCESYLELNWDVCPFCGEKQKNVDLSQKIDDFQNRKKIVRKKRNPFKGIGGRIRSLFSFRKRVGNKAQVTAASKSQNKKTSKPGDSSSSKQADKSQKQADKSQKQEESSAKKAKDTRKKRRKKKRRKK